MFKIGEKVKIRIGRGLEGIITQIFYDEQGNIRKCLINRLDNGEEGFFDAKLIERFSKIKFNITIKTLTNIINSYFFINKRFKRNNIIKNFAPGKIKFNPFQFRPLEKILNLTSKKILIADEVGVGKTIESGIILTELIERENLENILIICPKDLTSKWQSEMKNKFNIDFHVFSKEVYLQYKTLNPKEHGVIKGNWILSFSQVKSLLLDNEIKDLENDESNVQDLFRSIQLLIVDEVHHAVNTYTNASKFLKILCSNDLITNIIFLSATPLQLKVENLFTLLNLLDPVQYFPGLDYQNAFNSNKPINVAIKNLRKMLWSDLFDSLKQIKTTPEFQDFKLFDEFMNLIQNNHTLTTEQSNDLFDLLNDSHTFANIVNRTKRKDIIDEFPKRVVTEIATSYNDVETNFYSSFRNFYLKYCLSRSKYLVISGYEQQIASSLHSFCLNFHHQQLFDKIKKQNFMLWEDDLKEDFTKESKAISSLASQIKDVDDTKTKKLIQIINEILTNNEIATKKVLIFTRYRNTQEYIYRQLKVAFTNLRIGSYNGSTNIDERNKIRDNFRHQTSGSIDVLISTEVATEGIDFEFCSILINFDIPWNPMKIEQRIGRIDRYGQISDKVWIFNFVTKNTVEEKIFYRCFERLNIFNETFGDFDDIFSESKLDELMDLALNPKLSDQEKQDKLKKIESNIQRIKKEIDRQEHELQSMVMADFNGIVHQVANMDLQEFKSNRFVFVSIFKQILKEYIKDTLNVIPLNENKLELTYEFTIDEKAKLNDDIKNSGFDLSNFKDLIFNMRKDEPNVVMNFEYLDNDSIFLNISNPLLQTCFLYYSKQLNILGDSQYKICIPTNEYLKDGSYIFSCFVNTIWTPDETTTINIAIQSSDDLQRFKVENIDFFNKLLLNANCCEEIIGKNICKTLDRLIDEYNNVLLERHKDMDKFKKARQREQWTRYYKQIIGTISDQINDPNINDKIKIMKKSMLAKTKEKFTKKIDSLKIDKDQYSFSIGLPLLSGILVIGGNNDNKTS
ncbi:MAG: DEAD/DEAH box helicase family protein [Mycoplasmataceae bacterium]|nr:DEAD/DEAH box helicase family protein [Mycoplasmataceae bacterium]